MSGPEWLCVRCFQLKASGFCFCGGQETFLCEGCWPQHYTKNTFQMHLPVPISAYGQHRIPGYFERLQSRSMNFGSAKTELRKNLDAVDECIAELTANVQEVIGAVWKYGQMQLTRLQLIKGELNKEINEAIEEVERTMHDDSPILTCSLAKKVRHYSGDSTILKMFSYKVDASAVISAITSICKLQKIFTLNKIAGICENQLRIFNLAENSHRIFTLAKRFTNDISVCFLSPTCLLCIGSTSPSTEASLVNFDNAQSAVVIATNPLSIPRKCPGLICVEFFAYTFGSLPKTKSCEKYDTVMKKWETLPDMGYERGAFSPAPIRREIYLATVRHPIEVFNIDNETFRELNVVWDGEFCDSSSLFIDNELYIFIKRKVGRWRLGANKLTISNYECNERELSVSVHLFITNQVSFLLTGELVLPTSLISIPIHALFKIVS